LQLRKLRSQILDLATGPTACLPRIGFGTTPAPIRTVKIVSRSLICQIIVAYVTLASRIALAQVDMDGCQVFPTNNIWNVPIDNLPPDANSTAYVNTIGANSSMHADFGSGLWDGGPIGIPFVVVSGSQPLANVAFDYSDESDPGPYPIPSDAPIEGGPQSSGDRHVLVLDRDNCVLYELYAAYPQPNGSWDAGSGAVYDLQSNALRPAGWTSADAAGLPILPGLVRYDEVAAGEIRHAIRFTAPQTRRAYVWPARHYASSLTATKYPPMGQRFRLKSDFDISPFSTEVQVILRALKKYGMILADNGSSWYLSGVPDDRWDNDALHEFGQIPGSAFEAVDVSFLMVDPDSGQTSGDVEPPPPPQSVRDDDDASIQYVGKWKMKKNTAAFGGAFRVASKNTATVQFSISGTGFTWLTARGKSYGMATAVVDGVEAATVDLYSKTNEFQHHVTVTGLSDAPHEVEILVVGTRDSKPHKKQVVFDGVTVP
jgi:hypothetical protein